MNWSTMTPQELIFRVILLVVGMIMVMLIVWINTKTDEAGCLTFLLGLLAVTLFIGGVAGPETVSHFWGS